MFEALGKDSFEADDRDGAKDRAGEKPGYKRAVWTSPGGSTAGNIRVGSRIVVENILLKVWFDRFKEGKAGGEGKSFKMLLWVMKAAKVFCSSKSELPLKGTTGV